MTLPSVDERHEESTPAARLQIAAPSSADRRARLARPGLSGTVSSSTQAGDVGALGTSATSQASAPWSTSKTPRRNIVGLAPASGGLSQGTYLLLAATSPAKPGMTQPSGGLSGSASTSRPFRGRSSSQPNTPTRRRSRMNLRADDAAQEGEATPSVDAAARRAARHRSPDAAADARRPSTERNAPSTASAAQTRGQETPLDEDMPWASSAADQSRNAS
jgi:hypothetical protein